MATSMALLFLFLPFGYVSGLAHFLPGVRAWALKSVLDPLIYFTFFLFMLHAVVVWPITAAAYRHLETVKSRLWRVVVMTALLCPPVLSFAYYRGDVQTKMDALEMFLMVIPPAFLAANFYEWSRRPWVMSLLFGLGTFVPLFVINDLMNSFPTWASYSVSSFALYGWRIAFSILALLIVLRRSQPVFASEGPG